MGILDELLGGGHARKSTRISLIDTNKEIRPRATRPDGIARARSRRLDRPDRPQ